MPAASCRAEPLPPDERRAALVAVALDLVMEHGTAVSTRQIAQAAGVAEGTIFRVFDTKDQLIQEAVARAFDPAPLIEQLAGIREGDLETRLVEAVEVIQQRLTRIFHLMVWLRGTGAPGDPRVAGMRGPVPERESRHAVVIEALAAVMAPDRDLLRYDAGDAARRLWLLAFASTHPRMVHGEPLTAPEIVSLLLDGIRRPC